MYRDTRTPITTLLFVAAVVTLFSIACYKENPVSEDFFLDDFEPPIILDVDPENGAGGVDRNSQVIIRFSGAMDTASVSSNFHVSGGTGMRQWMDSLSRHGSGGHMSVCDDTSMMRWLDSISYGGQILWNAACDSCVFLPDSSFMPNADHMIFLSGPVRGQTGIEMPMDTTEYGGYVSYFQTGP